MQNDQFTEDEYYDLVRDCLKALGHNRAPDLDAVMFDYEQDRSPEESANAFAADWA